MTTERNENKGITFDVTLLNRRDLHNDVAQIIRSKLQSGIGGTVQEWQSFLYSPLRAHGEFNGKAIDQSARLIEIISLDVATSYLNDINQNRLCYTPAFLPQQSDSKLLPVLGKDSCDGLMVEVDNRAPNIVFVEQKSSMRDPNDSNIGNINDYFEDWINNLLRSVRGDRLFWIFNIMPYSDEPPISSTPFDLNKAMALIHSKKKDIYAGAICFYTHPDASSLEIVCAPIRRADLSELKNPDEIRKMRYSV